MDCVIVGGGVAGVEAALACRRYWPEKSVTLVDAEKEIGYYRTLLPQFMVRKLEEKKLFFWRSEGDPKLTVRTGVKAASLDRKNQRLHLDNAESLSYKRLILAPGGRPIVPPVCPKQSCSGVFPVRDLTTARAIREWLPDHPDVLILGGGLVGVKTAVNLSAAGFKVTLVEKENQLLPQALSKETTEVVKTHLHKKGIRLFLGCSVEDVRLNAGSFEAVLVNGRWIPCQTLLVAAGSMPDVAFLESSGLLEQGELIVSSTLQTRDEKIFAAGDAVTILKEKKFTPWTWPQAVSQGKVAAANLFSPVPAAITTLARVNSMNLYDLSLMILGVPVPGSEVIFYARPAEGIRRELFIMNGRIVGGALVGDISGAGPLHAMMKAGRKMEQEDYDLLNLHVRAFTRSSWAHFAQERWACIVS